jgi:hypothetical protein
MYTSHYGLLQRCAREVSSTEQGKKRLWTLLRADYQDKLDKHNQHHAPQWYSVFTQCLTAAEKDKAEFQLPLRSEAQMQVVGLHRHASAHGKSRRQYVRLSLSAAAS